MSLISRVEVTNYLTEGIDAHRRSVDWNPMLSGITLRMDGQSTLINITNGGGKTSFAEILLYLLSRDDRLLKRIRDKAAPRNRGYTHARIEFRDTSEDAFTERRLPEIDTLNIPGQTHVIGVVLNDDDKEAPVFYSHSGVLEDSPCYRHEDGRIKQVSNGEFVARTKALRGCRWNKFTSRQAWEDHIRLFLPVEVLRRNAVYQLKGSDDKNASFFDFTLKTGESYASAFFRAVVAPDLLSNLLGTFSEEDESLVEDTLLKSLSRIVDADREIERKERRLASREAGIGQLTPILQAAREAQVLQTERDGILRGLRKDIALLRHFGLQGRSSTVPGLPRKIPDLPASDMRVGIALRGMAITPDEGVVLLDKALSELTGIDVGTLNKYAERKQIPIHGVRAHVIDFSCLFGFLTATPTGGGHYRKGGGEAACSALIELVSGLAGAKTDGLTEVLRTAFRIAEAQLDTNPAAQQVRRLNTEYIGLERELKTNTERVTELQLEVSQLGLQLRDRQENQGAWDDFIRVGGELPLPEQLRLEPVSAKAWLDEQLRSLQDLLATRNQRHGALWAKWSNYLQVLEGEGLQGMAGVRSRHQELVAQRIRISDQLKLTSRQLDEADRTLRREQSALTGLALKASEASHLLKQFEVLVGGHRLFVQVFGEVEPSSIDPSAALQKATQVLQKKRQEAVDVGREIDDLRSLRDRASPFASIFGSDADPAACDSVRDHTQWTERESTARQSMAQLSEKKEAQDAFDELHPGTTPAEWLKAADRERARLLEAQQSQEQRRAALLGELSAIEQMRSVDDGVFEQAWSALSQAGVPAERLHHTIQNAGYPAARSSDVLSALSALLAAPVFDTVEQMQQASALLEAQGLWVPLVLKQALLQAAESGPSLHGELRMIAFLGGRTSRRVRILLDVDFAAAEQRRLSADLKACEQELERIAELLPSVLPGSDAYRLAQRASDAMARDARGKYLKFEADALEAEQQLVLIRPRITLQSLEVLRCAAEFKRLRGEAMLATLEERQTLLKDALKELEAAEDAARDRASPANLEAHRAALQYQRLGGLNAHQRAQQARDSAAQDLEAAEARVADCEEQVERLRTSRQQAEEQEEAFEHAKGGAEIDRLQQAVTFDDRPDDVRFMQGFDPDGKKLLERQGVLTEACGINFTRAQAYMAHRDKSEQDLTASIAKSQQELAQTETKAIAFRARLGVIRDAEVPAWTRLGRAIHEMAYEIGSRVARSAAVSHQVGDLEEGEAVPETHAAYHDLEALVRLLGRPNMEALGAVIEQVERVSQQIQAMDLQEGLSQHRLVDSQYRQALRKYTELNETFCAAAEVALGAREAAFNPLEIDEIRRATPATVRRLGELFEQLQRTLDKERDEALRAKRVAEETNEDTMRQLSHLIVAAEDNLGVLDKVMKRYPGGRFFFSADISKNDKVRDILGELKLEVERAHRDTDHGGRSMRRSDDRQLKKILRDRLIECVFSNTKVEFVNAGIWGGRRSVLDARPSTGQKIALEFMWIVRQAEYEIERSLLELSSKQAAKSRARTNRVILIDGIFSTLSNRKIISEALNGLRDLGGNFQVIGFLHSPTWVNDPSVFPIYHVGKKLGKANGDSLVSFREEGRAAGTLGFLTVIAQPAANSDLAA